MRRERNDRPRQNMKSRGVCFYCIGIFVFMIGVITPFT